MRALMSSSFKVKLTCDIVVLSKYIRNLVCLFTAYLSLEQYANTIARACMRARVHTRAHACTHTNTHTHTHTHIDLDRQGKLLDVQSWNNI